MMCILFAKKKRVQKEVEASGIFQIVAITILGNESDVFFCLKGNESDWNTA